MSAASSAQPLDQAAIEDFQQNLLLLQRQAAGSLKDFGKGRCILHHRGLHEKGEGLLGRTSPSASIPNITPRRVGVKGDPMPPRRSGRWDGRRAPEGDSPIFVGRKLGQSPGHAATSIGPRGQWSWNSPKISCLRQAQLAAARRRRRRSCRRDRRFSCKMRSIRSSIVSSTRNRDTVTGPAARRCDGRD